MKLVNDFVVASSCRRIQTRSGSFQVSFQNFDNGTDKNKFQNKLLEAFFWVKGKKKKP